MTDDAELAALIAFAETADEETASVIVGCVELLREKDDELAQARAANADLEEMVDLLEAELDQRTPTLRRRDDGYDALEAAANALAAENRVFAAENRKLRDVENVSPPMSPPTDDDDFPAHAMVHPLPRRVLVQHNSPEIPKKKLPDIEACLEACRVSAELPPKYASLSRVLSPAADTPPPPPRR